MEISKLVDDGLCKKVFTNRFSDIMKLKREYQGKYPLIDFGVGEEKTLPDQGIIDALKESLNKSQNHKYTDNGLEDFALAARKYLKDKHGSDIKQDEILPIMGAKSILAMIPSLLIKPGDYIITLKPSYVVLERAAQLFGANSYYLELNAQNSFTPEFDSIPKDVLQKTKIMNLNFPHNPTGATISKEVYQEAIALAKKYGFIIINDAAYIDINYTKVVSFLSVPGAIDVGVEIYSMSKAFNMTGFRSGFIAGNAELITLFKRMKDNYDSGQYAPIQYASIYALEHPEINERLVEKYLYRMKQLSKTLQTYGLVSYIPKASFFLYIKVPVKYFAGKINNAQEFASYLLTTVGIMTIPYDESGHYVRLSVTYEAENEEAFYADLSERLEIAMREFL